MGAIMWESIDVVRFEVIVWCGEVEWCVLCTRLLRCCRFVFCREKLSSLRCVAGLKIRDKSLVDKFL